MLRSLPWTHVHLSFTSARICSCLTKRPTLDHTKIRALAAQETITRKIIATRLIPALEPLRQHKRLPPPRRAGCPGPHDTRANDESCLSVSRRNCILCFYWISCYILLGIDLKFQNSTDRPQGVYGNGSCGYRKIIEGVVWLSCPLRKIRLWWRIALPGVPGN